MVYSPLEQFEIFVGYVLQDRWLTFFLVGVLDLMMGGLDLGFPKKIHIFLSNYFLIYILCSFFIIFFLFIETLNLKILPKFWFLIFETIYIFIFDILYQQVGISCKTKKAVKNNWYTLQFFPFLFTLFIFIFIYNYIGLIPFGFTLTSHLLTTFSLSFIVFFGFTILGVLKYRLKFLNLFIPSNIPKALSIFLALIELISYISRVFSLAIRLFANMMSGHALLFILTSFIFKIKNLVNFSIIYIWVCLIPGLLIFLIFFFRIRDSVFTSICFCSINSYLFK